MIDHVLSVITEELNRYLQISLGVQDSVVEFSPLVKPDGRPAFREQHKLLCTLVNVEQDQTLQYMEGHPPEIEHPPVTLNLMVLFSVCLPEEQYLEGMKLLSSVVDFFLGKRLFTPENTHQLGRNISNVTVEPINLNVNGLGDLWGALGTHYLPSVQFKFRVLYMSEETQREAIEKIPAK